MSANGWKDPKKVGEFIKGLRSAGLKPRLIYLAFLVACGMYALVNRANAFAVISLIVIGYTLPRGDEALSAWRRRRDKRNQVAARRDRAVEVINELAIEVAAEEPELPLQGSSTPEQDSGLPPRAG
jgi:hypothetical protein